MESVGDLLTIGQRQSRSVKAGEKRGMEGESDEKGQSWKKTANTRFVPGLLRVTDRYLECQRLRIMFSKLLSSKVMKCLIMI